MRAAATILATISLTAILSSQVNAALGPWMGPESASERGYSQHRPWDREFTRHRRIAHQSPRHAHHRATRHTRHGHPGKIAGMPLDILPHPAGCPRTAFCGCGVSVRVFGHYVRDLGLARNWFRFQRASPAAGNVAIFRGGGHVAYIERVNNDGTATLYDPNSGGHKTRLHVRSLAGAVIVDPRSDRYVVARRPRHYAAW